MSEQTCSECRYWDWQDIQRGTGDCRRYPPQMNVQKIVDSEMDPAEAVGYTWAWCWPEVASTDWCGEFSPRSVRRPPIRRPADPER